MDLRSCSQPWANLDKCALRMAYLGQMGARYDLQEELSTYGEHVGDGPRRNKQAYLECM